MKNDFNHCVDNMTSSAKDIEVQSAFRKVCQIIRGGAVNVTAQRRQSAR